MVRRVGIEKIHSVLAWRKYPVGKAMCAAAHEPTHRSCARTAFDFGCIGDIEATGKDIYFFTERSCDERRNERVIICEPEKETIAADERSDDPPLQDDQIDDRRAATADIGIDNAKLMLSLKNIDIIFDEPRLYRSDERN